MKKEKDKQSISPVEAIEVETIPTSFYGGENPALYEDVTTAIPEVKKDISPKKEIKIEKKLEAEVEKPLLSQDGKTLLSNNETATSSLSGQTMDKPKGSFHLILLLIVALLFLGGSAAAYYFFVLSVPESENEVQIPVEESFSVQEPIIDDFVSTSPTTTEEVVISEISDFEDIDEKSTNEPVSRKIKFPSKLFTKGIDSDGDGLSDAEEQIFLTSISSSDSDVDGYIDTLEIENLYNPKGFAPIKLVDSGLVKEFTDPVLGYRLYFPSSWTVNSVDEKEYTQLFSTLSNQFIEVSVFPKEKEETIFSWFVTYAPDEIFTNYTLKKNRFDTSYYVRNDGLAMLFDSNNAVYVLVYKNDEDEPVDYANILTLMAQSFRISEDVQFPLTVGTDGDIGTLPVSSSTKKDTFENVSIEEISASSTSVLPEEAVLSDEEEK